MVFLFVKIKYQEIVKKQDKAGSACQNFLLYLKH